MHDRATLRIFISSPADVRPERLRAEQIIARLNREFAYHFHIEAVLWEREPLVATHHFQDPENIPQPSGADIVVVILWSRLGVPLPAHERFRGAVSKRLPVTGTEWEFEDALAGARENNGVPDLLLYRKTAPITASLDDEAVLEELRNQRAMVQDFVGRWFRVEHEGSYTAASHSFATTAEFEEQLYDHLYALLKRRAGDVAFGVTIRWNAPPFRSLLPYEYEHAPVFFGRTRARNELRELLERQIQRETAFVLVFGASGSGKSSLVKAGLLPDLALPGMIGRVGLVRHAIMRPSDVAGDPLASLAAAILSRNALPELAELQYSVERLAHLLRGAPAQAALPIRQGLAEASKAANLTQTAGARLVIVVDQLEEIFTIERLGQGDRDAFVVALEALAKSGLAWVIATMRSDFFDRLEIMPGLADLSAEGRYLLKPPGDPEIGQIVRQPALEAGLRFEHDSGSGVCLDEVIRQAAAKDRGALPLLSFVLDQLWQRRTDVGMLTFAAYRELGGLEGAIGRRAEEVFLAQTEPAQRELLPLLRELVTIDGGKPVSRSAPLSRFAEGSPRRALAEAFLDPEARLLVSDGNAGRVQLRLAHEALLSHWSRARDHIANDARDLELRRRLEDEAAAWRKADTPREKKGRLIGGLPLAEARALLVRWGDELLLEIADFIAASRRAARRRRLRQWALVSSAPLAVALVASVFGVGLIWWGVLSVEEQMAFARVPGACFPLGTPADEEGRYPIEWPVRAFCLDSFELGKFELTQGQWRRVMVFNPDPSGWKGDERRPVENVSWNDARLFLHLMSIFGRGHYRLPTEAEWEYAARAGTRTARYWGESANDGCLFENMADRTLKKVRPDTTAVDCDDGYDQTAPVGSFKPNPFGLHDMLGNVQEWVEDCYVEGDLDTPKDGVAVEERDCSRRVVRGGSWSGTPRYNRSGYRGWNKPDFRFYSLGFRVVRTVDP